MTLEREELQKIYMKFAGMDELYVSYIQDYHALARQKDVYSLSHLDEKRIEITSSIKALKRERVQMANEVVEEILLKHKVEPTTKPEPYDFDTQGRMAYELQRQNDMKQWELQFQAPELDLETLKTMYDKNWGESDFMTLFNVEIEKIKKKNSTTYMHLMAYIESMKSSPMTEELEGLKRGFNMYASMDYFPYNLIGGSPKGVELRNVNNDMTIPENFNLKFRENKGVLNSVLNSL